MLRTIALVGWCVFSFGCEEKAAEQPKPEEKPLELTKTTNAPEVKPVKTAEPPSEDEEAQADVEANPLTKCCRALGQRGFMQRSPDYIAASKACGASMEKKESVTQALPAIKKALAKEALPKECQ